MIDPTWLGVLALIALVVSLRSVQARLHAMQEERERQHQENLRMLASIATSISHALGSQVGALGARVEQCLKDKEKEGS